MTCNKILSHEDAKKVVAIRRKQKVANTNNDRKLQLTRTSLPHSAGNNSVSESEDTEYVMVDGETEVGLDDIEQVEDGPVCEPGSAELSENATVADAAENSSPTVPYDIVAPVADAAENSSQTVPYDIVESVHLSENEADSESSETTSTMKTPPRRKGIRERKPRAIFAYNELGNPTMLR